jgi:plastocyanin domain-containing protein
MAKRKHQKVKQPAAKPGMSNSVKLGIALVAIVGVLAALFAISGLVPQKGAAVQQPGDVQAADAQVIKMAVLPSEYAPSTFTVEAGKPVRWEIDGSKAVGCTQYLVSQKLGVSKRIEKGSNVVEFMPPEKGTYAFSCGMNMVKGTITVV